MSLVQQCDVLAGLRFVFAQKKMNGLNRDLSISHRENIDNAALRND